MAIVNSSDVLLLQEDNSLYDPEPSENPRKRKRIPIACDACRARKSRVSLQIFFAGIIHILMRISMFRSVMEAVQNVRDA